GRFEHKKPKGVVVASFHEVKRAFWTVRTIHANEPVEVAVLTGGFPDGTNVSCEVRHVGHPDTTPPPAKLDRATKHDKPRARGTASSMRRRAGCSHGWGLADGLGLGRRSPRRQDALRLRRGVAMARCRGLDRCQGHRFRA